MLNLGNRIHASALYLIIGDVNEAINATKDYFKLPLLPDSSLLKTKRPSTPKITISTSTPAIAPNAGSPIASPVTTTTTVVTKRIIKRKAKKSKSGDDLDKEQKL